MDTTDFQIRLIVAIGSMGSGAAVALPELRLFVSKPKTCAAVANVLGSMGVFAQGAIPELVDALDLKKSYTKRVVHALGCIGNVAQTALPILKEFLLSEDLLLKAESCLAIFRISEQYDEVLPILRSMLKPNADGRINFHAISTIAMALGEIGKPAKESLSSLLEHAQNELAWVGIPVNQAIWRVSHDADLVMPGLLAMMESKRGLTDVLECLEEMGSAAQSALPLLKRMAYDENRWFWGMTFGELIDQDERNQATALHIIQKLES